MRRLRAEAIAARGTLRSGRLIGRGKGEGGKSQDHWAVERHGNSKLGLLGGLMGLCRARPARASLGSRRVSMVTMAMGSPERKAAGAGKHGRAGFKWSQARLGDGGRRRHGAEQGWEQSHDQHNS